MRFLFLLALLLAASGALAQDVIIMRARQGGGPPVCTNSLNFTQSCNSQYIFMVLR